MKTYVIAEGSGDAEIIRNALNAGGVENYEVASGSGPSASLSLAKSIMTVRQAPVALVLDAETNDPNKIEEMYNVYYDLLASRSPGSKFRVFLAAPDIETEFAAALNLGDADHRRRGFNHNELLRRDIRNLLANGGAVLSEAKFFSELFDFVRRPKKWMPTGR